MSLLCQVEPRFAAMNEGFGVCLTCKLKPDLFEKQLFQGDKGLPLLKRQYHPLLVLEGNKGGAAAAQADSGPGRTTSVLAVNGEFSLSVSVGGQSGSTGAAESCSCLEGNPCVDEYHCKDWKNRFEVAKKNGWVENNHKWTHHAH